MALVIRPEEAVGEYKGYLIVMKSLNPVQDYDKFKAVATELQCELFKSLTKS